MDNRHAERCERLAVGLGTDPPQVVERGHAAAGHVREKPAADGVPHESAATGDEDVHASAALRLWCQPSTIWSNVAESKGLVES